MTDSPKFEVWTGVVRKYSPFPYVYRGAFGEIAAIRMVLPNGSGYYFEIGVQNGVEGAFAKIWAGNDSAGFTTHYLGEFDLKELEALKKLGG